MSECNIPPSEKKEINTFTTITSCVTLPEFRNLNSNQYHKMCLQFSDSVMTYETACTVLQFWPKTKIQLHFGQSRICENGQLLGGARIWYSPIKDHDSSPLSSNPSR
jgi:hypothetical protein